MTLTNSIFQPYFQKTVGRTVGLDHLFDDLERFIKTGTEVNHYPPHNIIKVDDFSYLVELAVAGFKKEELDITTKDGYLTIVGSKVDNKFSIDTTEDSETSKVTYLHRGIGTRNFTKQFKLSDTIVIKSAELTDGILRIAMENVIPESKKPKKIEIQKSEDLPLIQNTEKKLLTE